MVIGFVISCPLLVVGGAYTLDYTINNYGRIRWRWLFRVAVWILMHLPREPDSLDWIAPPFVATAARRRQERICP